MLLLVIKMQLRIKEIFPLIKDNQIWLGQVVVFKWCRDISGYVEYEVDAAGVIMVKRVIIVSGQEGVGLQFLSTENVIILSTL